MNTKVNNRDSLGNRMKSYEYLSTSRQLMPNCPVYARIDGRAFHTFCHGLEKPYSKAFIEAMQEICIYLVKNTTVALGYVQSDEISLGWTDTVHCPFDGRIQKLESNLASMASAQFTKVLLANFHYRMMKTKGVFIPSGPYEKDIEKLFSKTIQDPPSFDCRVFNVPSMDELANAFLWRENDAIKNSISGMAQHFYSHRELEGKNSDEKVHMMRMKGYCFYEDTEDAFLFGTFYRREVYPRELTDEELDDIPEKQREQLMPRESDGKKCVCLRSRIAKLDIPYRLTEIDNKVEVLFSDAKPVLSKENPTFDLTKREHGLSVCSSKEVETKVKLRRYRPAFCSGFDDEYATVSSKEELLQIPWVSDWAKDGPDDGMVFLEFCVSDDPDCLMAFYRSTVDGKRHWYVVATIQSGGEEVAKWFDKAVFEE